MTSFKICGVKTPEVVHAAVASGAAHIGFNFFPPSPRFLSPADAAPLIALVPAGVGRVAVLVDPDDDLVAAVIAAGIDILQFHNVPPGRLAALAQRHGRPVWLAAGVKTRADIEAATKAAGPADLLLLDAKAPNDAPLPGGNGLAFDWRLLAETRPQRRFGLAGGLGIHNVADAIRQVAPALVDVASGVEEGAGVKSVEKIMAFASAVRDA
ncbi:phosphoribosylanthranilate isomerase [Sandarakinorhabdus cyanobacteriorum]|uniref:N-(5'-phosphoribosyl)anthranilate isomerase n=1 Tax=Sandarakinorhabdus cyanobacteriorum TaxID=1981098 RepID=A0A255Y7A7_9SPHN|nr:phosphoribosylanthranilate isomerase [Sandarakinorhabdus cyanobacteriorum]OYQ25003.1 phosphoribosylanthranilate isomerase [Sandarakinorhabdus cyanobacteriorum]